MSIVGLIPARGGSKGLPGKNIKPLAGKPLIHWTIAAASAAASLDRVIVSTDCPRIAAVARAAGGEVPFLRPTHLAGDRTPDGPVMQHLIDWLAETENLQVSALVYLRPTTPFKTPQIIDQCVSVLTGSSSYTSVRTITPVEGVHHPYWMQQVTGGLLKPFIEGIDPIHFIGRQSLPPCFRLNGVVDVLRPEVIARDPMLYGDRIGTVSLEDALAVDIDTPFDFKFCEFLVANLTAMRKAS
jgi:CMP-N,N'-diacetyllegionaminic acid synthase